jgi:hypothetical protein
MTPSPPPLRRIVKININNLASHAKTTVCQLTVLQKESTNLTDMPVATKNTSTTLYLARYRPSPDKKANPVQYLRLTVNHFINFVK